MTTDAQWLVFDPYLASAGGGERYMFAFVEALAAHGYHPVLAGPGADHSRLRRFGFPDIEPRSMTALGFIAASRRFDATVCLTNHPPPPSLARRRFAVVQFPFTSIGAQPLRRGVERWSLARTQCVVYSQYVRRWLAERWGVDAAVLPPPVALGEYKPEKKQRLILNVGRFFPSQHSKRQDALVDAYAALPAAIRREWRLVLAGGVSDEPGARAYLAEVERKASGLNADVLTNVDAATLRQLYTEASVYWHATGLDREDDQPEKAEHFGMTTVEAMSYGAVPVVIADGAQPEIVGPEEGVLWRDRAQLVRETAALIDDDARRGALALGAVGAAQRFGVEAFDRGVEALVARTRS